MDFKIKTKDNAHIRKYAAHDIDLAREFSKKVYKEFGTFIKAIVLFGSAAKNTQQQNQDIDVLVVVNDLTLELTPEAVETYKIIMQKIIGETNKRIHLTTLKITNFWDLVRKGDPIAINILRDGVAMLDTGFFDPLQMLLYQGRVRPTYESIYTYLLRAPNTIQNSKWHIMQATVDLYWAVIDASHAALMKMGEIPPSPEHAADMLDEKLVKKKHLEKKYSTIMREFYKLSKRIAHREIKEIRGSDYERYLNQANDFVERMKRFVEK
jgi:predicted nucleotidyltransferase/uncharacterized protein (UPF0332 family)